MNGPGKFALALLGAFRLSGADGARIDITSKRGMAMLALLATSSGGERTRAWLQSRLWSTRSQAHAQGSLRREISNLKMLVNADGQALLHSDHNRVWLDLDRLSVDVRALPANDSAAPPGEFLEGLDIAGEEAFEDWLREQRAFLERAVAAPIAIASELSLPSKPSIAVLPFVNLNGGSTHDDLADGIVEELSVTLSRFSSAFVIASSTSLSYRSPDLNLGSISRELGVRYLLEGSVRADAGRVRVAVRLIDGTDDVQVWADKFDDQLEHMFDLQERVAFKVAQLIGSAIEKAEMRRAVTRPVQSPDAYHLYWRANALFRNWDRESMREAIALAEQLLVLEPDNAWAVALAGFCNGAMVGSGWAEDPRAAWIAANGYCSRAILLGGDDPQVLGYAAGTLAVTGGDMTAARRLIDRALMLYPGSASLLFWAGWIDICSGDAVTGLERFEATQRLNPRSAVRPYQDTGIGMCLFALQRFEEAAAMLRDAAQRLPSYPPTLATLSASLAYLGHIADAHEMAEKLKVCGGAGGVLDSLKNAQQRELLRVGLAIADGVTPGPLRLIVR